MEDDYVLRLERDEPLLLLLHMTTPHLNTSR